MRKQGELKGMETPSGDKDLDAAAVNCKQLSKKRKRAQDAEIEGFAILTRMVKDKGLTRYVNKEAGLEVLVTIKEKVVVNEIEETAAPPEVDDEPDTEEAEPGEQRARKKKAPSNGTPAEA